MPRIPPPPPPPRWAVATILLCIYNKNLTLKKTTLSIQNIDQNTSAAPPSLATPLPMIHPSEGRSRHLQTSPIFIENQLPQYDEIPYTHHRHAEFTLVTQSSNNPRECSLLHFICWMWKAKPLRPNVDVTVT